MSQPQAVASPVAVVGPPSMMPVASSSASPPRNYNTIILVIVIIAIVVFLVFQFTKLNTMNKELKELKAEREQSAKLLKAMADRLGVQQDEKGEIQFVEKVDADECEEDGVECEEEDEKSIEQGRAECIAANGRYAMKGERCGPGVVPPPRQGCLFNLFGSRVGVVEVANRPASCQST